jgi:hypothetical protein
VYLQPKQGAVTTIVIMGTPFEMQELWPKRGSESRFPSGSRSGHQLAKNFK